MQKKVGMANQLEELVEKYRRLGIDRQLDYDRFYLYSIITHSTAIEGSTITELENQIMFDNGIALKGKSIIEQNMNLDLKAAYEQAIIYADNHLDITVDRLKELSALTMRNTGTTYHTMLGDFSSANGDLRLLNVSAGVGGRSYMSYNKVPQRLDEFCSNLNIQRHNANGLSISELYDMSFDAHYNLVTIHPWADGNGRMARLIMNWLQFEYKIIPSRIFADDKENYIKALVETREKEDITIFRKFMTDTMIRHLSKDIEQFERSTGYSDTTDILSNKQATRERIVSLLRIDSKHTIKSLSEATGISPKGIEKQLFTLKKLGKIQHVGPRKGGHWEVL